MKSEGFDVEFHFGVRAVKTWELYATALFLNLAVNIVSRYSKTDPWDLWAIIDEIGQTYNIRLINALILRVPELLQNRVSRDVDKAIEEYKDVVDWEEPEVRSVFSEVKEGETPLGGELRRRADWIED